jgi:HEPN domain-containing protein
MNRTDFQKLAEMRIEEAEALLKAKKWAGAYFLAGYAVECGFKACIAKKTKRHDYPDKDFAARCFTHKVEQLVLQAGLQTVFQAARNADADLDLNWTLVKDWDEKARYERKRTRAQAQGLYDAVTDSAHGVLPWIKSRW